MPAFSVICSSSVRKLPKALVQSTSQYAAITYGG